MHLKNRLIGISILILFLSATLTVRSQVTIGGHISPNKGALLDLKEFDDAKALSGGRSAVRGLLLPRVKLTDLNSLVDIGVDISTIDATSYAGMIVYHVGEEADEIRAGLYIWDGEKWLPLGPPEKIDVITTSETVPLRQPNCYMVQEDGKKKYVKIPIAKAFDVWDSQSWKKDFEDNSKKIIPVLPTGRTISSTNLKAELVWKDVKDGFVSKISLTGMTKNDSITVLIDGKVGNAVVALKDGNDILWSWHIWVTQQMPDDNLYTFNTMTWMDRNLGATSLDPENVNIMGLHYQWGRKDPFTPSANWKYDTERTVYGPNGEEMTVTDAGRLLTNQNSSEQNLINSIKNPFSFIYYDGTGISDWYVYTSDHKYDNGWTTRWTADYDGTVGHKSVSDPCPEGWCVPRKGKKSGNRYLAFKDLELGGVSPEKDGSQVIYIKTNNGNYPVSGSRSEKNVVGKALAGYLQHTGKMVYMFSASNSGKAYSIGLTMALSGAHNDVVSMFTSTNEPRARGDAVRCVRDN